MPDPATAAGPAASPGTAAAGRLRRVVEAALPLASARDGRVVVFRGRVDGGSHVAVLLGRPEHAPDPFLSVRLRGCPRDLAARLFHPPDSLLAGVGPEEDGDGILLYVDAGVRSSECWSEGYDDRLIRDVLSILGVSRARLVDGGAARATRTR